MTDLAADSGTRTALLEYAVGLYRGRFLANFSLPGSPEYETWMLQEQAAWEHKYLSLLVTLMERHTRHGDYTAAIGAAHHYLVIDDLAEDVHRRLISLYATLGNRRAALRQFERCAAVLERELGVRPLPETRAAYEAALQSRRPPATAKASAISLSPLPSLEVPLVGRHEAFRDLLDAFKDAKGGRGRVVLLSGEAGIGKSRLMEAFACGCQHEALVLAAAARYAEQPLPYQPVVEVLRSVPERDLLTSAAEPIWLAEATRVLPELRELQTDLGPPLPLEPEEARTRLLEALCRLIIGMAGSSRSLLLCLDDLHWADSATLDWLLCLARRIAQRSVLIVGSYRSEERRAVDDLRHDLTRLGILSELRLPGLDLPAVLQIVHHLTGPRSGAEGVSHRLHEATGGNPFFLLEILRLLSESGRLDSDLTDLKEVPLPDSIRRAVEERLSKLSHAARQVLEAAAVLGASFDFHVARQTAGRGEMETIDALDEAVSRQLLTEDEEGYAFRHALIKQAVEGTLGPVRRHLLHRRAARAMKRLIPEASGRIAYHYDQGGDAKKALDQYRLAASRARDLFAWRETEKLQDRMLQLADRLDPQRAEPDYLALRCEILNQRAHSRFLQGHLEDRDTDLESLYALAETSRDPHLRLQAIVQRVRYQNLDARYEDAVRAAEDGLALARSLDEEGTASRLLAQIGFAHYFLGQPQRALTALGGALDIVQRTEEPGLRGRIAHILGYVYFHLGDYVQSLVYQEQAYACHQSVGDQNRVAWDGLDIGAVHLELGDFATAGEHLYEHLELAKRIGARPAEAYGLTLIGSLELHQGNYEAARLRFEEAASLQQQLRSEHGTVAAVLGKGLTLYHLGEFEQARTLLRRCVDRARAIGHSRRLAEALIALGLAESLEHQPRAARSSLMESVKLAREAQCWECVAAGHSGLARVERTRGRWSAALEHARYALRTAQAHELRALYAWTRAELGLALLAEGKLPEALEQTSQAVAALRNSHEAWIGSEDVHRARAQVLRSASQAAEAQKQDELAEAIVRGKAERILDPRRQEGYLRHAGQDARESRS